MHDLHTQPTGPNEESSVTTDHDLTVVSRPVFFTAAETAEIVRLDESTLYRHLRGGTFPGLKIGGRYIVPGAVLDRLVDDVLATGRCVDLVGWTRQWRHEQAAAIARIAASTVQIAGGAR